MSIKHEIEFTSLKTNNDGLIPVIVQENNSGEVLMMAYMNEEAFNRTIESGRMTYYSRSKKALWVKGETSGNYQHVVSLTADCDMDTILARVNQVGVACHTGASNCFFNPIIAPPESDGKTPAKILETVMAIIKDRQINPKEGSYTNYLFDKGIDKILKKLGEESTEIVIAAKNPETSELVYEISDYLYHLMVLMVEKEISWDDSLNELSKR